LKILQVIPYFTPTRGGDVNVCYNLSKKLVKSGNEVTIATTDFEFDQEYAESIKKDGVELISFKHLINLGLFLYSPEMKRWADHHLKDFDVVHLHQLRSYQNNVIYGYASKYGIPYVLQPHGSTPQKTGKTIFKWLYDKFFGYHLLKDADRIIAVSKEEAKYDNEMGADFKKIHVIYNGMDIKSFQDLPKYGEFKKKYDINGKIILYLGRIHKLKGIDFVIKSFSNFKEVNNSFLVISGPDDGYRSELEKLIEKLNITDKVKFTGFLDEKDKISAYVDADLFVHTVIYMGGVGITPLEAILCGTPVIVTEQCGEVIKEAECGYLVNYGDIDDLKEKMEYVIENPEEHKLLTERGKRYIKENLSWDSVAKKIENVYHELNSKEGN
jgi:glycosyltransferase involved in cell wall biosynthesis